MKITEIHVYAYPLPVKNPPYTMSNSKIYALDTTLVKVVTDNGLTGWGETCPLGPVYQPHHALGARAALAEMAPSLIGGDALAPLTFRRKMDQLLGGHRYAKSALEIALYDLMGKHFGVRVADLLGGVTQERLPSYYATGIGEPEVIARAAAERVAEGFPRIQVKIGGRPTEIDIEVLHKVWERIRPKGAQIVADANRGMTARETLRLSRECQAIPLTIEQPCNTIAEIVAIKPQLHHAIFIDEGADDLDIVMQAINGGWCEGFGMKMSRIGGPRTMAIVRDLCEVHSLPQTCEDSWGGDIVAAACAHVGATLQPHLLEGVWIAGLYIDGHYDSQNGVRLDGGHITLPKGPGLGIEPDEGIFGKPVLSFG